ncbi:MAG: hypothetical protein DRG50_03805 [Deltaproteobacteria bacterium]|nr:MAG: hypothetical protein DRG50_03805 [Deltaproteobacteria bacterium]
MEVFVCLRQTAVVKEEPKIQPDKKGVDLSGLKRHLNEWDAYALEEALLLTQRYGGDVSVISLGPKEVEDVLFHGLAAGAKKAIHIFVPEREQIDNWVIANILSREIKKYPFDLILTGAQAEDDGCAEIGATLAQLLKIPHASLVMKVIYEPDAKSIKVERELEEGYMDVLRLRLPALLTIQTGINQPRYVSSLRLRRFKKAGTILRVSFDELISEAGDVYPKKEVVRLYPSRPEFSKVEMLGGSPEAISDQLIELLISKGVL